MVGTSVKITKQELEEILTEHSHSKGVHIEKIEYRNVLGTKEVFIDSMVGLDIHYTVYYSSEE